jgi:predicted metal-dependent hydrolase
LIIGAIRREQKMQEQEREASREFLERESHYIWGKRMILQVRPGTNREKCQEIVEEWYRRQIREAASPLVERWEKRLGVKVDRIFVQHMKTKWGSCNLLSRRIRLNTDLAKKPPECLEYIVIHELMHRLEPTHNARFQALMDRHFLQWRPHKERLNRLPVLQET